MKKIKSLKGFIIAQANAKEIKDGSGEFVLFTKDEWEYGEGCRYPEWECEGLSEAIDFINNY
jgi:hypothetical protein